ncbi:hypothetical protein CPT_Moabite_222 [Serratia phage Moabite]|uniref:Uncharacterized protein n=2 Tax=Moabitevirus moabite TaxID=2846181 RepID=A0A7T3TLZ8_9CAUD|nr:hypothetical protein HWC48_gp194 [Serratia phage Moabite]QPX76930.1 hypothetical protein [Serratia phage vB_SmaM_Yaphecito]UCR74747.1 hypothetical protein [Serratia phage BUCT660]UGO54106.1 hypothetical protein HAYMO_124 [Serratia phage vB_SmaM_Haymo]UQT03616.1 hypothetical protein KODAMA_01490 [Serratia phage vB_SmaM-Kodama]URG14008.1 hypothetical protein [Pectobacterium phage vB_ParM-25]
MKGVKLIPVPKGFKGLKTGDRFILSVENNGEYRAFFTDSTRKESDLDLLAIADNKTHDPFNRKGVKFSAHEVHAKTQDSITIRPVLIGSAEPVTQSYKLSPKNLLSA